MSRAAAALIAIVLAGASASPVRGSAITATTRSTTTEPRGSTLPDTTTTTRATTRPTTTTAPVTVRRLLWFPDADGVHIASEARDIEEGRDGLLGGLRSGPRSPLLREAMPTSGLTTVEERGATLVVDLSPPARGALGRQAVAVTLKELPGVEIVQVDGEEVAIDPALVAPITVSSPVPGERVGRALTVTGTASVFEATVSGQVLDAKGAVLTKGFTTASEGAPGRGDYALSLSIPDSAEAGAIVVEVFEVSAKDGSVAYRQQVPLTLAPA